MKLTFVPLDLGLDFGRERVQFLIIESPQLLRRFVFQVRDNIGGRESEIMLDDAGEIEIITDIFGVDINNSRTIATKLNKQFQEEAVGEKYFMETQKIAEGLNEFAGQLVTSRQKSNIAFTPITPSVIIKALGLYFADDKKEDFVDTFISYMTVTAEYLGVKFFVALDLRATLSDEEFGYFVDRVTGEDLSVLLLERQDFNWENIKKTVITREENIIYD